MNKWMAPTNNFCVPHSTHPGAFGSIRAHSIHTGVDIYADVLDEVYAVEDSVVVSVGQFTGLAVGSPWYKDTGFVMAEGASGVVNYGEIDSKLSVGDKLSAGDRVGSVQQVLYKDKGNGLSMLHLELYYPGTKEPVDWPGQNFDSRPIELLDPTANLLNIGGEFDCTFAHMVYHANPGCIFRRPIETAAILMVLDRISKFELKITALTGPDAGYSWCVVDDLYYTSQPIHILEWK